MFGSKKRARPVGRPAIAGAGFGVPSPREPQALPLGEKLKLEAKMAFTGALGILAALIIDLQNRGDSSALFVVARALVYLAALVGVSQLPLYAIIGVLMALGAAVVLYFRPRGLRPAFMTGFGSLAALMTLVPGYSGEAIGVPTTGSSPAREQLPIIEEGDADQVAGTAPPQMRLASFLPQRVSDRSPAAEPENLDGGYTIKVRMAFPNGVPEPVALRIKQGRLKTRLFNPATGKAYNLFLSAGGPVIRDGDRLLVETTIPSNAPKTALLLRIEADGYEINVSEAQVGHGPNPVWDVGLVPTSEPLLFQRLKHTYAF